MHILIAEDDPLSRLLLRKAVERLGHRVSSAADGAEALHAYQDERPDVIISDWMMPELEGPEFCRRVRDLDDGYTYFILLTSNADKQDRLQGMRAGADDYLTKPLDTDDLQLRLVAAERVTRLHRKIQAQQQELEALNRTLYVEGRRDALTDIPNRLALRDDLEVMRTRLDRGEGGLSVALFDIDNFKKYNDSRGHLAGDDTLRAVAQALAGECRPGDRVYRYGGEEFCAVFDTDDLEGARSAVERMRVAVLRLQREHPDNTTGPWVTISCGVATHPGTTDVSLDELLDRADGALYQSKEAGRNQVTAWAPATLRKTA